MGPITYALCQKPLIGAAMWITSLCAFPPLFSDEPISLQSPGATITRTFTAPVDKRYPLAINFVFPTVEARLKDEIVGSRYEEYCRDGVKFSDIPVRRRVGLGRPIPFRVVVRRMSDKAIVVDRTFESLCVTSYIDNVKDRTIGWIELTRGEYLAEITSLQEQAGLTDVKTFISLYGGQGK